MNRIIQSVHPTAFRLKASVCIKLWRLLKAEMAYHRTRLLVTWLIGCNATLAVVSQFPADRAERGMLLVLFWTAFMALMGGERLRLREKTDRRDQLLPFSNRQLALSRYLFPAVCWVLTLSAVLGVLLLWQWQGHAEMHALSCRQVLSVQGILAFAVGLGRCFSDLRAWVESSARRQWLWAGWKVMALITLVPFFILFNAGGMSSEAPLSRAILAFFASWAGVSLLNLAGVLMLGAGFWMNLRKDNRSNP